MTGDTLAALACSYVERQTWFQAITDAQSGAQLQVESMSVVRQTRPGLARLRLGLDHHKFQLFVGWREPSEVATALRGREGSIIGPWDDDVGPVLLYDALGDDELCLVLLERATGGREQASRVRRVSTLVSHASLVFDERMFMKCYRVLQRGARPEVEVVLRLDGVGFNALLAPMGHWREDGYDLALVREFQPSALEGRLLALTSLRDVLAHASENDEASSGPDGHTTMISEISDQDTFDAERATASAGGDLASEMRRLGATTARLHLALAAAFGDRAVVQSQIAEAQAAVAESHDEAVESLGHRFADLDPNAVGRSIRLHGDYHLRRVMRSEAGWLVAGFSDDPLYAVDREEGSASGRRGSPLEDLADMCFSLRRVASEALMQRPDPEADHAERLADAWVRRNQSAFLEGYVTTDGARRLLPRDPTATEWLLEGFELARERRYEATSAEV